MIARWESVTKGASGIPVPSATLFGTTIKDWLDCFENLGHFNRGGLEPPTHHMKYKLEDGTMVVAEVVFLALDREDHVKKLRGVQGTWGWLNEVKEIPFAVAQMLDLRMGRYPKDVRPTWYGLFGDTNACDTDHWYYRMGEELKPEGWLFLRQPGGLMRTNIPAFRLPESVIDEETGYVLGLGVEFRGGVRIDSMKSLLTEKLISPDRLKMSG